MKFKRFAAVILIVSLLAAACSRDKGGTFSYDIAADPKNLDPQLATDAASMLVIQNTFEGLMTYDQNGALTTGAAVSYTVSEDGTTYVFKLNEDAKWSVSGQGYAPVTAHDFVFAFQRIFDPNTQSPYIKEFLCIKNADAIAAGKLPKESLGVYASATRELTVELAYPFDGFLALTASTAASPCNGAFFAETKGKYGTNIQNLAFNGPFALSSWRAGRYLIFRRNQLYHTPEAVIPQDVTLYVGNTGQQSTERFLNADTDVLSVSGDRIESLVAQGYGYEQFQDTTWALLINPRDPTLSNRHIRLAYAYAFTSASYINQFPIWLKKAGAFIPPVIYSGASPYRQLAGLDLMLPYLPENALQHLNDGLAELALDSQPKITVLCPSAEPFGFLMQYVQQTWQGDLSTFVGLERRSEADIQKAITNGAYQIALVPFRPDSDNISEMLTQFGSDSPRNVYGYSNPDYDALLAASSYAITQEEATACMMAAERLLMEDGILIPFAYQTSFFAVSPTVENVVISPFGGGLYFKYAQRVKR